MKPVNSSLRWLVINSLLVSPFSCMVGIKYDIMLGILAFISLLSIITLFGLVKELQSQILSLALTLDKVIELNKSIASLLSTSNKDLTEGGSSN